jgi:hypothetical protein
MRSLHTLHMHYFGISSFALKQVKNFPKTNKLVCVYEYVNIAKVCEKMCQDSLLHAFHEEKKDDFVTSLK